MDKIRKALDRFHWADFGAEECAFAEERGKIYSADWHEALGFLAGYRAASNAGDNVGYIYRRHAEPGDIVAWIDRQSGERTVSEYPSNCCGPSSDNPNWRLVVLMPRAKFEACIKEATK